MSGTGLFLFRMQRLPISFPAKSAPSTPVVDLARALGVHPFAVALATIGISVEADALVGDFGEELTWWVTNRLSDAQALCVRWEHGGAAGEAPAQWEQFSACMRALDCMAQLSRWAASPHDVPADIRRNVEPREVPLQGVANLPVAAALYAAGFVPVPEVFPATSDRGPVWAFPQNSTTYPALRLDSVIAAIQRPTESIIEPITLPGYPPEEHPFLYGLQCVLNLPGFAALQESARRAPRVGLRSKYSQRSAIVSADSIREGRKDTAAFRDRLHRHLTA